MRVGDSAASFTVHGASVFCVYHPVVHVAAANWRAWLSGPGAALSRAVSEWDWRVMSDYATTGEVRLSLRLPEGPPDLDGVGQRVLDWLEAAPA